MSAPDPTPTEARRPRLLDLFCGAGGAAMGYHRADLQCRYPIRTPAYHELAPPVSYEDLVLGPWDGFPGTHSWAYGELKRKAIEQFVTSQRDYPGQRILLLTGLRRAESKRRQYAYTSWELRENVAWANPLFSWSHDEMDSYRRDKKLPRNPVAEHMHMSGECLCGSRARPGELDEWRFFWPEFAKRVDDLAAKCRALGKTYCEWGHRPPKRRRQIEGQAEFMPMCVGCERDPEAAP